MGRASRKHAPQSNGQMPSFVNYFLSQGGQTKSALIEDCVQKFALQQSRSVFSASGFNIRFCSSSSGSFANTVLSLSKLQRLDSKPFLVCLVGPTENSVFLANSTFVRKLGHSSKELSAKKIRGSFNGSDILREYKGIKNEPANFQQLFREHQKVGFDANLKRIARATKGIKAQGQKLSLDPAAKRTLLQSPQRTADFLASPNYRELALDLQTRLNDQKEALRLAAQIANTNLRGRAIEFLIGSDDQAAKKLLLHELRNGQTGNIVESGNDLADYSRDFKSYSVAVDIKSKLTDSSSNPKAYSVDKALEFLAKDGNVFLFYFVGINSRGALSSALVPVFQEDLLQSGSTQKHWSSANSRGHVQFNGHTVSQLLQSPDQSIDISKSQTYLRSLLSL